MKRSEGKQTPEELLDSRLKPGERILWKGRPVERSWTGWDTGKLLFGSALFGVCLIFFLMLPQVLDLWFDVRMKFYRALSCIGIFISVLVVISLLIHSLRLITSPWRKRKTRRNTRYLFTDRRLIAVTPEPFLFFPSSQKFCLDVYPIPRRRRIRILPYKDDTGDVILKYRKRGSFIMEGIKHPEEAANILKKLMVPHFSSESEGLSSSADGNQPVDAPEEILNRKLKPKEQVLWKSRPVERYWTFSVVKKIMSGTAMLIFPLVFILGIWSSTTRFILSDPIFYFFVVGLVCIGLAIFSNLIYSLNSFAAPWKERKRRRNTLYILTEHRLITVIDQSIRTYSVHKIKGIRYRPRRNGSGDIILKYGKKRVFRFKDIMNAREAVDILKNLRTAQPTPERER